MAQIILTKAEAAYHEKYYNSLEKLKIFNTNFVVSCALCTKQIHRDEITSDNFHGMLHVILCNECKERRSHPTNSSCGYCGKVKNTSVRLTRCKNECDQKFCSACISRMKRVASRMEKELSGKFCGFCDPRLLWEDRAICSAIIRVRNGVSPVTSEEQPKTFIETECIFCCENEATESFEPCGHQCLCSTCLPGYKEKFTLCPLCNSHFTKVVTVPY